MSVTLTTQPTDHLPHDDLHDRSVHDDGAGELLDDEASLDASFSGPSLSADALDAAVSDLAAGVAAGRWSETMARGSIAELVYASGIVAEEVRRYRTPPAARDDVTSAVLEKLTIRILATTPADAVEPNDLVDDPADAGSGPTSDAHAAEHTAEHTAEHAPEHTTEHATEPAPARVWFDLTRAQTSSTAGWVRATARNLTMTAVRSWRRQAAAAGTPAGDDLLALGVSYDFVANTALAEAERRAMTVESFTATTTRLRGAANARLRAAQARELLGITAPRRPSTLPARRAAQALLAHDPQAARRSLEQLQNTGTLSEELAALAPVWHDYAGAETLLEENPAWCHVLAADAVADWPLPPTKDLKRLRGTLVAAGPGGKPARDLVTTWVSAWVAVHCETTSAWTRTPADHHTDHHTETPNTAEDESASSSTDPALLQDVYDETCALAGSWPGQPWGRGPHGADALMWAHATHVLGDRIGVGTVR